MNAEIDWLCYIAVQNGLFSQEQARALYNITPEESGLMDFAQAVLANKFTDDVATLQSAINKAAELGAQGPCTASVLIDPAPAAPAVEENAVRPAPLSLKKSAPQSAPAPQEATAAPQAAPAAASPVSSDAPISFDHFPNLGELEHASDEECRKVLEQYMTCARELQCSDIHISALARPHVRRFQSNFPVANQPILTPELAKKLNLCLLSEKQKKQFEENWDIDYCCTFSPSNRFRSNVMIHNDGIEGSYRTISDSIKTLRELGFERPDVLEKLTTYHQGLVLITGPVGSGKSTTLASMVQLINKARQDHIITVEDPVEIIIPSANCNVSQRELHSSTKSFANALKAALREDPDVIILGEMRDLETIEMGLSAAETGHLVIGTLHTRSASSTLDRILDVFPPDQQGQIRAMLAESLKGIICQDLMENHDGTKVLMVPEILIGTLAVGNLIKDANTHQLQSVIETSSKLGMVLKENSLMDFFLSGDLRADQVLPQLVTKAKIDIVKKSMNGGETAEAEHEEVKKKKGWLR